MSISDQRYHPLTGTFVPETITDEEHTIAFWPEINGYGIKVINAIQLTNPRTVTVVEDVTGGGAFSEQTARVLPNAGQFWVDYESSGFTGTSWIIFNSADVGTNVVVSYKSLGTNVRKNSIAALMAGETIPGSLSIQDDLTVADVAYSNMVGSIVAWPASSIPSGWLYCNGQSVLRASYPALFAIIGDDYGAVDGSHFTLPDYRGYMLRGMADGQTTDPDRTTRTDRGDGTTGDAVGTKQQDAVQYHNHTISVNGGAAAASAGNFIRDIAAILNYASPGAGVVLGQSSFTIAGASNQSGHDAVKVSEESRPKNIAVKFIIRAA